MKYAYEDDITTVLLWDYALPVMSKDVFIQLAKRVVNIYSLDPTKSTIDAIASNIVRYLSTPFGSRAFKQLIK